jgi:hypothetical protein
MPTHQRFRLDNPHDLQDRRKPSIHLEEEPAIIVREPGPAGHLTPQNDQLMSKRSILCLKPALRLEWRGQDGKNETEQPDHSASLGDSITSSTRIRFSVHTGLVGCAVPLDAGRDAADRGGELRCVAAGVSDSASERPVCEPAVYVAAPGPGWAPRCSGRGDEVRIGGEKHLHRYLSEFDFRYSNRVALGVNDGERADIAIKGAAGKRLTYRQPN